MKPGPKCTFLRSPVRVPFLRSFSVSAADPPRPGPARPDAAPQLALDGLAEAVAAEVVALERRADLLDPGGVQSGDDQRTVGAAPRRGVENRGQSARPARHPWQRTRR